MTDARTEERTPRDIIKGVLNARNATADRSNSKLATAILAALQDAGKVIVDREAVQKVTRLGPFANKPDDFELALCKALTTEEAHFTAGDLRAMISQAEKGDAT